MQKKWSECRYVDHSFREHGYRPIDVSIPSRRTSASAIRGGCNKAGGGADGEYRSGIKCRWLPGPHFLGITDRSREHGIPPEEVSNFRADLAQLRSLRCGGQDSRWLQS